ncbi:MAG TPA: serine/threonine-protein kinase [Kofleriaceae bacterium]|nr:serine/threonine-protein kinase [Kofleriaceae bacterium]
MRDDCPVTGGDRDCLDDNLIGAFVGGHLAATERRRVEAVIDRCAVCRRQVSEVMRAQTTVDATASAAAGAEVRPGVAAELPPQIGRYQVRRRLGEGGMGIVVAAWDPELEREVAIKLVRGGSDEAASRLAREARAMARVRHPAVITVFDAGVTGGEVFVAMELIDSETLADWFARRPSWQDALARCRTAGAGLAAAHASGLVHRDFKPQNVLCDRDGRVVVTDFGLARRSPGVADATSAITGTGEIVGTPLYMAPEQHLGQDVGPAADQFAFAATLYEGLYGQRAFGGTTLAALISDVLSGRVRPPPEHSPVPPAIRTVIERGLAIDPAARFASLQAMLDALDAAVTRGVTPVAPASSPVRSRRRALVAAGGAALAIAAAAAVVVTGRDRRHAPSPVAIIDAASPPAAAIDAGVAATASVPPPTASPRWDVLADEPAIAGRARAWAPDAALIAVTSVGAGPDGTADLTAGAFVGYTYLSPARTVTDDLRFSGRCIWTAYARDGAWSESELTSTECPTMQVGPRLRCTLEDIWRRAQRDGADPAKPARIEVTRGRPWMFEQRTFARQYPDDC